MIKIDAWIVVIFVISSLITFQGCVTEKASLQIENSLSQNELAYYNDSFDRLREGIWEDKHVRLYNEAQMANFKFPVIRIKDGKLTIKTKIGYFSKGSLSSKFALKGDFDIQIDCHIDFLDEQSDMVQSAQFIIVDKTVKHQKANLVTIGPFSRGQIRMIFTGYREKGARHRGNWKPIINFHGSLRIMRIGDKINTLYKHEGQVKWQKLDTFLVISNDVRVIFGLSNFGGRGTSIDAKSSVTAAFDNFKINAAQEIIEDEI